MTLYNNKILNACTEGGNPSVHALRILYKFNFIL